MNETTAAWIRDASCVSTDPDEWYPGAGNGAGYLRAICDDCPVRTECLAYVMEHEPNSARYGIWAGLNPKERRALYRKQRAREQAAAGVPAPARTRPSGRAPARCGTRAAYERHVRNQEPIDAVCEVAHEEHLATRRKAARQPAQSTA
jgi:hypothetical protein